eukprot:CAMPEP_0178766230 /NCGR_PEP_ID=MMETSP0744-20121128/18934_1 /TAXON_ID=913974 /ORGANISM="Nitzschia punctata, Strain CCMP561" /LENGTH=352 /DNA_ID=CAMNT_0020421899 /DNA_START=654 /DNA_END=1710 /DNA_ORIENTATION=+
MKFVQPLSRRSRHRTSSVPRNPLVAVFLVLFCLCHSTSLVQSFPNPAAVPTLQQQKFDYTMTKQAMPTKRMASFSSLYRGDKMKLGATMILLMDLSSPLWKAITIYAGADSIGFLVSVMTGSHLHLDLIGTGAFALPALYTLILSSKTSSITLSQQVSSIAVCLWATKLAAFLFLRALQLGHDARLTDTLFMECILFPPIFAGLLSSKSDPLYVGLGSLVYGTGLIVETLADAQKWFFKQSHPGQFCNVGLWSISQHPNFFGNLVLWFGILVMNIPALTNVPSSFSGISGMVVGQGRLVIALLSPMFMWALFYGQAIGAVTPAAQQAMAKYGDDPEYQKYIAETPLIIPKLW